MPSYLLLRNNKQTGPLSKEQLIQLGLKPYDLVWVEGKSAAWRYPGELPELRDYAPLVEEQPFDRFYKKQTEESKEQEYVGHITTTYEKQKEEKEVKIEKVDQYMPVDIVSSIKKTEQQNEQASFSATINDIYGKRQDQKPAEIVNDHEKQEDIKPIKEIRETKELFEEKYEQYLPKKSVTVIMPKQPVTETKKETTKKEEPVVIHETTPVQTPVAKKPIEPITDPSLEVETKYSQPLDEIKEMYVKQLQDRKHKTAQKKFIIQSLKRAAVFIAIIGSGVLIGFAIKPKHTEKNNVANAPAQNTIPANTQTLTTQEASQLKNNNSISDEIKQSPQELSNNRNELVSNEQNSRSVVAVENKSSEEKKNVIEEKGESLINKQTSSPAINASNGERNKNLRTNKESEPAEQNAVLTENISKLVSVKSNDYKIGAFGGVRNLELTVTNDSKYSLDNVIVELQYLKLSDQPVKIDHVRFQSVAPNGTLTIRVPDNKRGAKLLYKIIKIEPKDNSTAGL